MCNEYAHEKEASQIIPPMEQMKDVPPFSGRAGASPMAKSLSPFTAGRFAFPPEKRNGLAKVDEAGKALLSALPKGSFHVQTLRRDGAAVD
jgi:hypothetical protein